MCPQLPLPAAADFRPKVTAPASLRALAGWGKARTGHSGGFATASVSVSSAVSAPAVVSVSAASVPASAVSASASVAVTASASVAVRVCVVACAPASSRPCSCPPACPCHSGLFLCGARTRQASPYSRCTECAAGCSLRASSAGRSGRSATGGA